MTPELRALAAALDRLDQEQRPTDADPDQWDDWLKTAKADAAIRMLGCERPPGHRLESLQAVAEILRGAGYANFPELQAAAREDHTA
jgi:hypothetical protein